MPERGCSQGGQVRQELGHRLCNKPALHEGQNPEMGQGWVAEQASQGTCKAEP